MYTTHKYAKMKENRKGKQKYEDPRMAVHIKVYRHKVRIEK